MSAVAVLLLATSVAGRRVFEGNDIIVTQDVSRHLTEMPFLYGGYGYGGPEGILVPAAVVYPAEMPSSGQIPIDIPSPAVMPAATPSPAVVPAATPSPAVVPVATPSPAVVPAETPSPAVMPAATPSPAVMPAATPSPAVMPAATPSPAEMPAEEEITPSPAAEVAPIQPGTPSVQGQELPPANTGAPAGQGSTIPGCSVDHLAGMTPGCEQCQEGFFKIRFNPNDGNEQCYPCSALSNCLLCNDYVGCGQCATGYTATPGNNVIFYNGDQYSDIILCK